MVYDLITARNAVHTEALKLQFFDYAIADASGEKHPYRFSVQRDDCSVEQHLKLLINRNLAQYSWLYDVGSTLEPLYMRQLQEAIRSEQRFWQQMLDDVDQDIDYDTYGGYDDWSY